MNLSRRDFFKLSGAALTTLGLSQFDTLPGTAQAALPSARVRILQMTHTRAMPDATSSAIARLLPDTVHALHGISGAWAQLADGYYVPLAHLQPMVTRNAAPSGVGWAQVGAPFAGVRAYAAPDAPLLARLGHGAILAPDAVLKDAQGVAWQRAALNGQTGWVQSAHLQAVPAYEKAAPGYARLVDNQLQVWQGARAIGAFALVQRAQILRPGRHIVTARQPGADLPNVPAAPWMLTTESGLHLSGVYWNAAALPAPQNWLGLSVVSAEWVYAALGPGSRIDIDA
ncbi:MAG: twin-arginine translocation signal domain-containing protein [Anaerolineales bacterium]